MATLSTGLADALARDGGTPPALFMSQAALAKYAGVSRMAVTKHKDKLVFQNGQVDVIASWHALKGETDPVREAAHLVDADGGPDDESYNQARRRKALADAKRAEIELGQLEGKVVYARDVQDSMANAGGTIRARLDRLPGLAGKLTAVARTDGEHGVKAMLKTEVRDIEQLIVDSLTGMVGDDTA